MYAAVENTSESVPAFLVKLWTLVEDPSTDNLIQWDSSGTSFHVYDQQSFSREILPLYFKHNNIASFIRQLNMYGFRKVAHIEQGGLKVEKDDLQFQHQYFQRGERDLLQYIKRKVSARAADTLAAAKPDEFSRVLTDVKQVKVKQDSMDQNLEYIKRENKLLWREVATLRQKHHKQQQIVNKLIQFLVSLVSSNRTGLTIPPIRRMPLAINDVSQLSASPPPPPVATMGPPATSQQQQDKSQATASSVSNESVLPTNFMVNDGQPLESGDQNYTIESPKMENFLYSPADNATSGPIIHELTEPLVSLIPGTLGSNNVVLAPNQILVLPAKVESPSSSSQPSGDASSLLSPKMEVAASPKIDVAPSLEDALNFGLIVPSTSVPASASTVSPPPSTPQQAKNQQRKRKGQQNLTPELSPSPSKRVAGQTGTYATVVSPPSGTTGRVVPPQLVTSEPKQLSSPAQMAAMPADANLTVAASKDTDEFTLSSDQLDLLSSDMDGLKSILQDQYKVDPTFLMELFESSNPWPVIPEKDLDELKMQSEKDEASASTSDVVNVLGNELVEYNPRDELFPELMADNIMADIDDID